jgi:hypothetical protein
VQPLEPFSWKVFQPRDRKTISSVAVHNLTYGRQNNLFLICKRALTPTHTLPSLTHRIPQSRQKRQTSTDARNSVRGNTNSAGTAARSRTTRHGTSTASCGSLRSRGSSRSSLGRSKSSLPLRWRSWLSCVGRARLSFRYRSMRARARSELTDYIVIPHHTPTPHNNLAR